MNIICHRGLWTNASEKNTPTAFRRAFSQGYGTETDLRDSCGELVISHDMPLGDELSFHNFLNLVEGKRLTLALNIKSDGLAWIIAAIMKQRKALHWFVFDMSIPDMQEHLKAGNPVFARMSELEPQIPKQKGISGIWLDAFENDMWRIETLHSLAPSFLDIAIVSPELHGRDPIPFWSALKKYTFYKHENILLCTDLLPKAKVFFGEHS